CDYFYRSFVHQVVPEAIQRGIAPIGMKSLAGGHDHQGQLVVGKVCTVAEALRYALSRPVAAVVSGIDSMDVLKQNVAIARAYKPFAEDELKTLLAKVKPQAGDGRHEKFKSTQVFDSPHHQKQHHFMEA